MLDPKPIDNKDEELPSKTETDISEKRHSENFLTKPNTSPRMETLRKRSFRQSLRESTLWESMPNLNNPMARYKESKNLAFEKLTALFVGLLHKHYFELYE